MQLTEFDAHRHSITTRSGEISYIDIGPAGTGPVALFVHGIAARIIKRALGTRWPAVTLLLQRVAGPARLALCLAAVHAQRFEQPMHVGRKCKGAIFSAPAEWTSRKTNMSSRRSSRAARA